MASASQFDSTNALAGVQLEVRQGERSPGHFSLDDIDFLIGSVPGCDLRVAEGAGVLCLFARHATGATLRRLAPTQTILVNGNAVTSCELNDNDRVQMGALDIVVRVTAVAVPASPPNLDPTSQEFQIALAQFHEQRTLFQNEKDDFERQKQLTPPPPDFASAAKQHAQMMRELEERGLEIERQQGELAKVRQELGDTRRQLYDHYQERREQLVGMQGDLEQTRCELDEREKKVRLEEMDAADGRQRDRARQEELDRLTAELTRRALKFDSDHKQFEQRQLEFHNEWAEKNADLAAREKAIGEAANTLVAKTKQYEEDVLRLSRREGELEKRATELQAQASEWTSRRDALQRDGTNFEAQLQQIDEWCAKLAEENDRLEKQKQEQNVLARQLTEQTASLEGQQASVAVLRGRLERMRDETRVREQQLDQQRTDQEALQAELTRKQKELDKHFADMQNERAQSAREREQMLERCAVLETAVRQLKLAQDEFLTAQERLRTEEQANDERSRQHAEADGILQGRLAHLADAQGRLDLELHSLRERGVALLQREEACHALQEQLHRRADEITERHKEITERLQEHQTKLADLDGRQKQLDQREEELNRQIEARRQELEQKTQMLEMRHTQVADVENVHQDQWNQLAGQRMALADERAQFQLEQLTALEKFVQARADLEAMRQDTLAMIDQLPDAELRAGAAVDRLSHAREQLRNHLGEVHQYVRQCQDELMQLRARLQADLDKLIAQEETLRRNQDEHRLAAVAFRQQLIDWQGQIGELKRLLARDETRLERREAKADERARAIEAESARLAQQAEVLEEQERSVADRREEVDRHLVDMREWYRKKLREVAGIPLVPDALNTDAAPTILPAVLTDAAAGAVRAEDDTDDEALMPTSRSILSIAGAGDPSDRQLGQTLRDLQLIDGDTLTALLSEARRQRRSLRQVLLASGVITLYQLALIEAGNVDGLMLGPVRIIDRLRNTSHEAVYRVFDPRRGAEAVLRHLSEEDMADAVKPDEFRQRFTQAKLNDIHVANTLEVFELAGRPAVMQEWLSGLPAVDWPPLAAAPGVCYRLLTQAAQGLAAAHQAGAIHGHLTDALLLLTADGVLKICGLGEPPWLIGLQYDEEPTVKDDLRALGRIASGWCTPTGVRKGAKTKPLPEALVSILYRLAAEGDAGYRDVKQLLEDLEIASSAIPPNAEAWDRLVKYVREHGTTEAMLRQSA